MKYLLDTDVLIHLLRGKREIAEAMDSVGLNNCCISEITKAELLVGAAIAESRGMKNDRNTLERLLECIEIIPISNAIETYASEKARLLKEGTPIEDFDLLIACSAVCRGVILVSGNTSHMTRVAGVRLADWSGIHD